MRALLVVSQLLLLAVASCKSPAGFVTATPVEIALSSTLTPALTSTPTLAPYWDQLPLTSQPDGGWKTYRNDELNLAFQYPAMYDQDKCRKIWFEDKYWREPPTTVIGLGPINITVVEAENWTGNLTDQAAQLTSMPETQVLAAVESFSMDEVPAFRAIVRVREQTNPNIDYTKQAFVAFAGRFYQFTYFHMLHNSTGCDAPLFSEEAVYDHLLSTVEFDP